MDGTMAKAQSKSNPALQSLKRPLELPELLSAAKLPHLGQHGNAAGAGWSLGAPGYSGALGGGGAGQLVSGAMGSAGLGAPKACGPAMASALPSACGSCAGLGAAAPGSLGLAPPGLGANHLGASALSGQRGMATPGLPTLPQAVAGSTALGGAGGLGAPLGGQQTTSVEIPQDKVQLVLGAQAATIKAIKAISGASCYLQQSGPTSERALLTMSGTPAQIEKCRGLVMALVDGVGGPGLASLEAASVAGVSALPSLPSGPGTAGLSSLARPPNMGSVASLAPTVNPHLAATTLKGVPAANNLGSGGTLPGASAASLASLVSVGGNIDPSKLAGLAGASGNSLGSLSSLLAGVLNSSSGGANSGLYTQLLTAATHLVSTQQSDGSESSDRKEKPQAFDREALKRLAQQAQESQEAPVASVVGLNGCPTAPAALETRAAEPAALHVPEVPLMPPEAPSEQHHPAPEAFADAVEPQLPAHTPPPPPPEVQEANTKKDSSSVLGILQQAQDNVARGRVGGARGSTGSTTSRMDSSAASSSAAAHTGSVGVGSQLESLNARIAAASSSSSDGRRAIEKDVLGMLQKLEPRRITDLVTRVHDVECLRSEELLDDITRSLIPLILRFGSPDLTRLTGTLATWALETMDGGDEGKLRLSEELRAYFNGVSTEVSLRLMDVAPGDLARIASSLASMGLGGARLFASIARAAVARSDRFIPHELVALVLAFDQARFFQTALFEALAKCLKANIKDVAPKDVIQGMRLLAMCGIQDKDLGQAIGEHMPKKASSGGLSAEEFCTLAWTFCALDLHHDRLFRAVFQALEDAELVAGETLCQLYEIHLTLKAFHQESYREYELEDDTVQRLRYHYKKHRGGAGRAVKLERSSERVHSDVAEQLRDVIDASVSTAHQMSLGFTVDVAATKRRSSLSSPFVFIEIDGPHSLVRSLDPMDAVGVGHTSRVRGAASLKRRVLQKHGFRVGVVNEDEWRTMSKSKEKREFLRDILVKVGVSDDRLL